MEQNKIILYQDDNEITRVAVRFADEDLWLTQNQLAEIYCTSRENITMHIKNIYADEELLLDSTSKDFLLVREEGSRQVKRNVAHYNLDMIIALGYRVQSQVAVRFRKWATQRLNLLVSGFLDFAEFQALEMNPMTMKDWIEALDGQITAHKRKVLIGKGTVSHAQAIQKAEQEFEIYRQREMEMLESDFDREIKKLKEKNAPSSTTEGITRF